MQRSVREHVKKRLAFLADASAKALTPPQAVSGHSDFKFILLYKYICVLNKKSLKWMISKERKKLWFESINFYISKNISKNVKVFNEYPCKMSAGTHFPKSCLKF